MTRILRDAAEVRDRLEQARTAEDSRLAKQQSDACLALIGRGVRLTSDVEPTRS